MKTFLIYLPFLLSFFIGYLTIHFLLRKESASQFLIEIFLSLGLGLGISANIVLLNDLPPLKMNPNRMINHNPFHLGLMSSTNPKE